MDTFFFFASLMVVVFVQCFFVLVGGFCGLNGHIFFLCVCVCVCVSAVVDMFFAQRGPFFGGCVCVCGGGCEF